MENHSQQLSLSELTNLEIEKNRKARGQPPLSEENKKRTPGSIIIGGYVPPGKTVAALSAVVPDEEGQEKTVHQHV